MLDRHRRRIVIGTHDQEARPEPSRLPGFEFQAGKRTILVSSEDLERVSARRWHTSVAGRTCYAYCRVLLPDGKQSNLPLHRFITGAPDGAVVDHVNGNGLDNRRENLRVCSHRQNIRNQSLQARDKSSRFKGVWRRGKKWHVMIEHDGDKIWLGKFDDEERAARQYDRMARVLFGPFARTNAMMGLLDAAPASARRDRVEGA